MPNTADSDDYRAQAREGTFGTLATSVIEASGIDLKAYDKSITALVDQIAGARTKLDTKIEGPEPPAAPSPAFEPLPGIAPDAVCRSRFDVNDLALRGRKA